ncbi:hypothetical protein LCGC14_1699680, partial [marine sediment metagenome]
IEHRFQTRRPPRPIPPPPLPIGDSPAGSCRPAAAPFGSIPRPFPRHVGCVSTFRFIIGLPSATPAGRSNIVGTNRYMGLSCDARACPACEKTGSEETGQEPLFCRPRPSAAGAEGTGHGQFGRDPRDPSIPTKRGAASRGWPSGQTTAPSRTHRRHAANSLPLSGRLRNGPGAVVCAATTYRSPVTW